MTRIKLPGEMMILALIVGLALVASGAGHAQGGCVGNAGCALWTDCHDGGASFGPEGRIACLERELTAAKEKPVQRKYSLGEIDSMRQAVQTLHSPPPLFNGTWTGTSAAQIEDELRTYMANGTSPEELWKRINERQK